MSAITNVWRQLVQRRLWPVAILLIAALAAVPLALAQKPDPAVPAPVVPAADAAESAESALAVQPIVAQATAADRGKRRKVLGARKNVFGLPPVDDAGSAAAPNSDGSTTAQDPVAPAKSDTAGGTSPGSGGSPTAPSTGDPATPPASDPAPAPRTYAMHELTVRFGDAAAGTGRKSLKRLQPLPSAENPVLIYLGVLKDGKTAVFLVDHGVSAVGDGDCRPSPEECETLRLKAGDTEFLDVIGVGGTPGAQYQLDLIKIHQSTTASASRAMASSKAGRLVLKARVSSDGPTGYRWDAAAGALKRTGRTLRATFAHATVSLP